MNATDVDFESKSPQDDAHISINNQPETIAANITLAEMQKLTRNQRVVGKTFCPVHQIPITFPRFIDHALHRSRPKTTKHLSHKKQNVTGTFHEVSHLHIT